MKAVIQRINSACVKFGNEQRSVGKGILIFLGIKKGDTEKEVLYLTKKILNLRIFENEQYKMDKNVLDIKGDIMVISEFTLYGDCKKGNRPDFGLAEEPSLAEVLYNKFIEELKKSNLKIVSGKFRSYMEVEIVNDGPVTFVLEI